jgi:hypothetical protein
LLLRRAALLVWELPQNVLGAAAFGLRLATGSVARARFERERIMVEIDGDAAVSLGLFVFFTTHDTGYVPAGPENRDHEYGHSIQSRWLGPLYLPIVGVPSVMRVLYAFAYRHVVGRRWCGYYDGFPERWADELGGVDRTQRPAP